MGYQLRRLVAWHGRAKGWAHAVVNEIADMVRDDDPTGPAWPGIARLSRVLGCDSRTVRRAIQEAVKAGDIKCEAKSGAPNRYTLTPKLLSLCQGGQPDSTVTESTLPGQPDRGVLSQSPGGTVTLTPEPQENHKGTTNQPPVVADAQNDTGPIPFSDPDPFTRAARRAGIGSQPSKRVAVAKEKAAAKFDLGELENAPAIKVHRDVCGYVPMTPEQARQIVASVNGEAETTWRLHLKDWMGRDYHAGSIERQLSFHETENKRAAARASMPKQQKAAHGRTFRHPQIPDPTPEEYAAAEKRAHEWMVKRAAQDAAKNAEDEARRAREAAGPSPEEHAEMEASRAKAERDAAEARIDAARAALETAESSVRYLETRDDSEMYLKSARKQIERCRATLETEIAQLHSLEATR